MIYKAWWNLRNNLCELFITLAIICQTDDYDSSIDGIFDLGYEVGSKNVFEGFKKELTNGKINHSSPSIS